MGEAGVGATGAGTTTPPAEVPAAASRHRWARVSALNPRLFLARFLVSGVAVIVTVLVVPGLGFTGWRGGEFALIALTYAVLSAVLKPALEFVALRFLVATYGLVIILVNALTLFVLAQLMDDYIVYDRLWQLLLGGLVVGVVGIVLETAVGATQPVLDTRAPKEAS